MSTFPQREQKGRKKQSSILKVVDVVCVLYDNKALLHGPLDRVLYVYSRPDIFVRCVKICEDQSINWRIQSSRQ